MSPYRILIVEDEKIIAKDLEIRLKRMNYSVAGAVTNCDDVLAMLRSRPVDLILMDIMIDGPKDGIDTAFIVRQEFDVPIIFLTAYADESTFQRAKLSDPFGYILKPFQERELDLTIQTVLQKHALEKRIKENEERYRRLFESTQESILILDDEASVVDCNPAARVLYSGFGHEIIGKKMTELNGSAHEDRFTPIWKTTLDDGKASGRFKITDPEGVVRYVDFSTQAHYMPGRHLVVLRDVTRKVLDQREIETLARIPAEAPSPILRLSAEGKLIYANRSAERLLKTWRHDNVLALPPAFLGRLKELEANGGESVFNLELEGRQYSLLAVYVPKGRYINIYATDITDKYLNEKLIAFQKDILELVAVGSALSYVLEQICRGLHTFLPGAQAAVIHHSDRQWRVTGSFDCGAKAVAEAHNGGAETLVARAEASEHHYRPDLGDSHLADLLCQDAFPDKKNVESHVFPVHAEHGPGVAAFCMLWPEGADNETDASRQNLINLALRLVTVAMERDSTFRRLYNQSLAFENINDAIILTDLDGHVTEWSPAAERIFHYQKGDILGKRFHDLKIFNGSADLWLGGERKNGKGSNNGQAGPEQREAAFVLPDGEHGWAEISIIDMKDPGGNLVGRLKVARDITKKKNVEKALNLSEQHLKAIFDNSVQSFILLDMDGKVVAFNRQAQKWVSEYMHNTLMKGQHVSEVWQTGNEDRFKSSLTIARQGGVAGYEDFLPSHTTAPAWFELNFLPVLDADDKMTGICFTALDIRERKASELNLARSEARFRSLVQNSSDLILLCDHEGTITYASESSLRITGYTPEKLVGRRLFDFTHARDKVRLMDSLHQAEEEVGEESVTMEYRFVKADRSTISIEATITSRLHDPAIASLVLNNRDISERKAAEESLRNIVRGVSGYTGEDYFTYLTENLSTYLAIPDVLLAEYKGHRLEPLALVYEGEAAVWGSFDSKGAFISDVLSTGYLFVTNVPGTQYAADPLVSRFKAGTIIGVALRTSSGQNMGVMVAASPKPFQNFALAESMLKIFSVRAATELERIYATRALEASQANLSALIENTTDAIFSIDRHLHLTALNSSFRQRFRSVFLDGVEPGDDISKLMQPTQARNWLRWLDLALQGKRHEKDIALAWKNGEASYEVSFNPIVSEVGFVTGVSVFARDITARKQAETALKQSEANLMALIENTDDIIYSLDDRFRLITGNSSFRSAMLAIEGNPGPGSREVGRLSGPMGKDWAGYYERVLSGEKFTEEFTLMLDGHQKDIETSFNPIASKGNKDVSGVSVFARDITERKRAENELKRTNFELDSFVYRASHDLRAPLRSVLGLINLIKLEASEAAKMGYLALAEKSINKLDTFISDLTHFSRNTRLEIARSKVDFDAIIQECVENLRYMENANRLNLKLDLQPGDFYSDPQRISILFQNLISNAIKYQRAELPEGEGFVNISIHEQDGGCLITVQDNGKGIREEYLQKIFDMFFRASEESYGSGLGLYITRQVIDKLGGWVKVESVYGQGTTFRVFLPSLPPLPEAEA